MRHSNFAVMNLALLLCLLATVLGCGTDSQESTTAFVNEVGLPTVGGPELERFVQASEVPVLVEFGVDFNCPRCAQTKSDVVRLRESLEGKVDVIRVDFNANAQMVAKLGGTICPTYVLFAHGQPAMTRSFPVSIDLLEGEILRLAGDSGK